MWDASTLLDLSPQGVIVFLVECVVAGSAFGAVVRLLVEARRVD